jgi:hypothetical protein
MLAQPSSLNYLQIIHDTGSQGLDLFMRGLESNQRIESINILGRNTPDDFPPDKDFPISATLSGLLKANRTIKQIEISCTAYDNAERAALMALAESDARVELSGL